jgi:hypothetical protein
MYQLTKKKQPLALKVLIFVVVCAIVTELLRVVFRTPTVKESLSQAASNLNKRCPIMIDSLTRLNNVIATNGLFVLNYTLVTISKDQELDTIGFKQTMKTEIANVARTNPLFKDFREEKMTLQAMYSDKVGNYLCSVLVSPEDYN